MTITAIILTLEQVKLLKGTYNNIAALEPVAIGDGRFFLPLAVLSDSNFSEVHAQLAALPMEEIIVESSAEEL